jgi:ribose 5-phosphate isomerase A
LGRLRDLLRTAALRGVAGVPTSLGTEAHAAHVAIPVLALANAAEVHLSIDGADKVNPDLNLVKGRGGSLLREKMIKGDGGRFVVDESKLVPCLACTGAVPVEFVPFLQVGTPRATGSSSPSRMATAVSSDAARAVTRSSGQRWRNTRDT